MERKTALERVQTRLAEINARQLERRSVDQQITEATRRAELTAHDPRTYYARCRAAGFATNVSRAELEREEERIRSQGCACKCEHCRYEIARLEREVQDLKQKAGKT